MKRWTTIWLLALVSVASLPHSSLAASGDVMWKRTFGTNSETTAVATHAAGVYAVGTASENYPTRAFVRSYTEGGTLRWVRSFTSPAGTSSAEASARDVVADSSGVYVVGTMGMPDEEHCAGSLDGVVNLSD